MKISVLGAGYRLPYFNSLPPDLVKPISTAVSISGPRNNQSQEI